MRIRLEGGCVNQCNGLGVAELKGREIISLPVVTMDGQTIGEVKDIVYDPGRQIILGYVIENKKWLKDGRGFLHDDLVKRENDCLYIREVSTVKKLRYLPELKKALDTTKDLRGMPVENGEGRYMGVIQDLILDGETNQITGYEVSDGVIQDLLNGRRTISKQGITINADKVIASTEAPTESF